MTVYSRNPLFSCVHHPNHLGFRGTYICMPSSFNFEVKAELWV